MDFQHVYDIHRLLDGRRTPLSKDDILNELKIDRSTFYRIKSFMVDQLFAPIETIRGQGYQYKQTGDKRYELPGIWFSSQELITLSLFEQLLETLQPSMIKPLLQPMKAKVDHLLVQQGIELTDWQQRLKILPLWQRNCHNKHFNKISTGLLQRKRLNIEYKNRQNGSISQRTISPQQLIYYRDNWYLDGWCHLRNQLRTFSIDAIKHVSNTSQATKNLSSHELNNYYSASYGIFSGTPVGTAIIEFSPKVAAWVADETWHPEQQSQWTSQGNYQLSLPFSDTRELIKDIMRFGAEVEVMAPATLRQQVKQQLEAALKKYK